MIDPSLSAASQPDPGAAACGVCRLHSDRQAVEHHEILRLERWLLRHHPLPAPLAGWLLLDVRRHAGGPADLSAQEATEFGPLLQRCSALVRRLTGCERVYTIAFGEGARHLHAHLIPRHAERAETEAWRVADLYRAVAAGAHPAAEAGEVERLVRRARELTTGWR